MKIVKPSKYPDTLAICLHESQSVVSGRGLSHRIKALFAKAARSLSRPDLDQQEWRRIEFPNEHDQQGTHERVGGFFR